MLAEKLRGGGFAFTAWSSLPDPLVSEVVASTAFDAVTLDMQHGGHSTDSVLRGIGPVVAKGKHPIVRIPVGRFDMASRALDMGAEAVIAPMINSVADAKAFAASMKYPPVGERSWGPHITFAVHNVPDQQEYLETANRRTLSYAMIETREAYAELDAILAIDGIDGVFVGPSDFSIAWTKGKQINALHPEVQDATMEIGKRVIAAGKLAAAFSISTEMTKRCRAAGFTLLAVGVDEFYLRDGANAALAPHLAV